jgi:hypothetical protein
MWPAEQPQHYDLNSFMQEVSGGAPIFLSSTSMQKTFSIRQPFFEYLKSLCHDLWKAASPLPAKSTKKIGLKES